MNTELTIPFAALVLAAQVAGMLAIARQLLVA